MTGSSVTPASSTSVVPRRWAWAACTWCVLFGLLSLAWAAGLNIGLHQLSPAIQDQARNGGVGFTAILIATGIVKIVGGAVPLNHVLRPWPRWARPAGWLTLAGGVLLSLYGLGDVINGFTGTVGIRSMDSRADRDAAFWYLVLWGPVWSLGGVLFFGSWWSSRRTR